MGKKFQDTLKFLGSDYSIKTIDMEPCIYRKISDKYDIEISGLNSQGKYSADVYIWNCKTFQIDERIFNLPSKEALKFELNRLILKYSLI